MHKGVSITNPCLFRFATYHENEQMFILLAQVESCICDTANFTLLTLFDCRKIAKKSC